MKVADLRRCLAPLLTDDHIEVDEATLRDVVKRLRRMASRYAYPASDARYNKMHDVADEIERDVLGDW